MAQLPAPTLSFTIPSHQDDTVLECRMYHPKCLTPKSISEFVEWNRKAAIVAHPYATLGGCMDDPVVALIGTTLLNEGFVLGTFNFRGAGNSEGRTSWQGKGEQNDYMSFIAFMICYLHYLCPPSLPSRPEYTQSDPEFHDLTPVPSQALPPPSFRTNSSPNIVCPPEKSLPLLLLAGYSYGALITSLLPPITQSIIAPYTTPSKESTYASIRLRAHSLASQQNNTMVAHMSSLTSSSQHRRGRSLNPSHALHNPKLRGAVRVGGEESLRRASHESHRSFSIDTAAVRKSVDRVRSMASPKRASMGSPKRTNTARSLGSPSKKRQSRNFDFEAEGSQTGDELEKAEVKDEKLAAIPNLGDNLRIAYLLVSPLQGIVSNLLTLPRLWASKTKSRSQDEDENDMKFTIDPTLAVFGDSDVFVSVRRLRSWAESLSRSEEKGRDEKFRWVEVSGAGHFWHRREDCEILRDEVGAFVRGL